MISKLPGHTEVETTACYFHLTRDSLNDAAAPIAASVEADLVNAKTPENDVPDQGHARA